MAKKHSKTTRVFVDDADLSGSSTSLTLPNSRVLSEATGFSDGGRKYLGGPSEDVFSIETIFDEATDESDEEWQGILGTEKVVTLWPGGDAISAVGYGSGNALGSRYSLSSRVPDMVIGSVEVNMNAQSERIKSLQVKDTSAITANENGTSIDDSASSSSGGSWYYHVFTLTASGGNTRWVLHLQDSANDSTWADVDTVNVTAQTSGRRTFSGTLDRYVRQQRILDATSGTLISSISYLRS